MKPVSINLDEGDINVNDIAGNWGKPRLILTAPQEWDYKHLSWPKIVQTARNNLILACSVGIGHNMGGSGLTVSLSDNNGRSFSAPKMLRCFPQFDNRYHDCGNYAIGTAEDSAVILLAMAFNRERKFNTIFGFRSEDEGETWQTVDTDNLAENTTGSVYGHIFHLPNGRLGVVGHYRPGSNPHQQGIWLSVSDDNGKTWSPAKCITEGNYVEPAMIYNRGKFVGLLRKDNGRDFYTLAVSEDGDKWDFKPNAFDMEPAGESYPSPFITADPLNPDRLWALSSVRHEDIILYSADMKSADNLLDMQWKRVGTVVQWGGPGEEHADWSYPWMCHLGEGRWMCVFYYGRLRGRCDIYGLELQI